MSDDPVFDAAMAVLLPNEGGYVNDPADPGGETNFGISKRSYPDEDIKGMTRDRACFLYRRDWWDKYGFGQLPAVLAVKVMDTAVNVGAIHAVAFLQSAIVECGHPIDIDGHLGPITLAYANALDATKVLAAYRKEVASYYEAIVKRHPREAKFLHGWLKRATK
jgi:lysozyme family protein